MFKHAIRSTVSLTAMTCVVLWPSSAPALMRPLSSPNHASIQFSHGVLGDPIHNDANGLSITGCSQLGADSQVCLQWLGDAITTCLDWGEEATVTACMQHGGGSDGQDDYDVSDVTRSDWGFSVELTIQ